MPNTEKKPIPKFHSEQEEQEFWANADSTEYVDWDESRRRKLPKVRPSLRTMSIHLLGPAIQVLNDRVDKLTRSSHRLNRTLG